MGHIDAGLRLCFHEVFHGALIGAGVRYRGEIQIGNRANDTLVDPQNPAQAIDDPAFDADSPVYMES